MPNNIASAVSSQSLNRITSATFSLGQFPACAFPFKNIVTNGGLQNEHGFHHLHHGSVGFRYLRQCSQRAWGNCTSTNGKRGRSSGGSCFTCCGHCFSSGLVLLNFIIFCSWLYGECLCT
ncbi:hypothetical protein OWV82_023675 [Melia azedarach]|uniref:Uncharacterized protein n=1 Tax=Melia azedarach TaxID=155640 RepID=A0ACC1WXV3_MELAZ|nr:hypothetical protein OWV82_023675 [Melia azedarach]